MVVCLPLKRIFLNITLYKKYNVNTKDQFLSTCKHSLIGMPFNCDITPKMSVKKDCRYTSYEARLILNASVFLALLILAC